MVKKLFVLLATLIFLFFSSDLRAQDKNSEIKEPLRIVFNRKSIKQKEILEYSVKWLGMDVGKIILRIEGLKNIRGHRCYHITAVAFPNDFLNGMWNLDYKLHSYIDYRTLKPLRFEKIGRINKEFNHTIIDFDQKKNQVGYLSEDLKLATPDTPVNHKINLQPITDNISSETQDLLSVFYYFRFRDIEENSRYNIDIYYDQKNWPIEIKTEKAFLKEIGEKGKFSVIKISLESGLNEHLFGGDESVLFLTCDSRHIPFEFKIDTALGAVTGIIQEIPQ